MTTATAWVRSPAQTITEISGESRDWDAAKAAVTILGAHQIIASANRDDS